MVKEPLLLVGGLWQWHLLLWWLSIHARVEAGTKRLRQLLRRRGLLLNRLGRGVYLRFWREILFVIFGRGAGDAGRTFAGVARG